MELYSTQQTHLDTLYDILTTHGVACDSSTTGAGKTIVCVKLAKKFGLPLVLVGPPLLRSNWTRICQLENVPLTFLSAYSLQKVYDLPDKYLLAIDECHLFKNACERNLALMKLIYHKASAYVLFISATFFDHIRQMTSVSRMLRGNNIFDITSHMNFEYPTNTLFSIYHTLLTEEEQKWYQLGERRIASSTRNDGRDAGSFSPEMFNSGLLKLHQALYSGLVRYVYDILERYPREKVIVSLKYKEHFLEFKQTFPCCLVLNGNVHYTQRKQIIDTFQEPNLKHRLLCVTDTVGGVGIDLDDQEGSFPRRLICLPLFASDFLQMVGRIRRRTSRSWSKVVVMQPYTNDSYFIRQLENKMPIVSKLNHSCAINIESFERAFEHLPECAALFVTDELSIDIYNLIQGYACSCADTLPKRRKPRKKIILD